MNCKQGTDIIIHQILELLESIDNQTYREPIAIFKGSTIGQHFRHILDFYNCLARGAASGLIDYALRERNLLVETDTAFAHQSFREVASAIHQFQETTKVEIKADFTADNNAVRPIVSSSLGRELMYAYDHAVHHLAMIKMGLRVAFPHIKVEENVGIAPSTLKHWKEQQER
jgi:uncharacterized damage-inducible protein DinB